MHLSKEIQEQLYKLNSNVRLASTIDGTLPDNYVFYNKPGRSFRISFAATENEYSIVIFERTDKLNYENCFARGLFTDLKRLSILINEWVDKQQTAEEISKAFFELKPFEDFEYKNPNSDVDKAWTKIKNIFFNDTEFWQRSEWRQRYLEMLSEAKQNKNFSNYFPFTSHYCLRFSIDKDLKETWPLGVHIIPTVYSEEVPESLGKFYVSYNDKPMSGKFFKTAQEGLDFYAKTLKEMQPIKW